MKRILPLILALVAGMAKADSNSDYRAGSDFARQIQGQGTGSIQSFKPQESIPGYNANPDETKYYGGVTAGGDGGLKNDGTTEWATGETGKTITESFMNKPKDILSPDAPFIQTGRDVVNRADSIVGNTGQQCSAQQINRSEFTNYTCERDTMVEDICAAPLATVEKGHAMAQRCGGEIQIELFGNWTLDDARDWHRIGVRQAIYHRGRDAQASGQQWGEADLARMKALSDIGLELSITGGITPADLPLFKDIRVKAFIAGRALAGAANPAQVAGDFHAQIDAIWGGARA